MKTTIEFLKDPSSDEKEVLSLLHSIMEKGKNDPDYLQLFSLIMRGMEFLERHGLMDALRTYFQTTREDGYPYTIKLIKELRDHKPLFEFRVNWKGLGAFRVVFFEHTVGEVQVLCFARGVIKQSTHDPEFERIAHEVGMMHLDFLKSSEKYINLTGVEEHD